MKKVFSVLLSAVMIFMLAVPVFAADKAKFRINVVSETDNEISITIDYEGGATFSCYDFELKYNAKKLSVKTAFDGAGFDAFSKDTKMNGGAVISTINSNGNPIKGTCATTAPFKVVNGKDLAVINFKKLSSEKVGASDISLVFTNCQTAEFEDVKTAVESDLSGKTGSDTPEPDNNNAAESKTDASTEKDNTVSDNSEPAEDNGKTSENEASASSYGENAQEIADDISASEDTDQGNSNKKVIAVAAAAVCMLFVIAAVCVYVVKKTKKDEQ